MLEILEESIDKQIWEKADQCSHGFIKKTGFYNTIDSGFILRQKNNKNHVTTFYYNKNTRSNFNICRINVSPVHTVHILNNKIKPHKLLECLNLYFVQRHMLGCLLNNLNFQNAFIRMMVWFFRKSIKWSWESLK